MLIDLQGRVAIVTGAGKGIGRHLVTRLATEGVSTVSVDLSTTDLEETKAELDAIGGNHLQLICDIRDQAATKNVVVEAIAAFGKVDILVNNAGVVGDGPIETLSEERWDLAHDVNLKGTFLMSQAVIPAMKANSSGRIINAASFAAITPIVGSVAYASAKAAVAQFSRGLAGELGPWNITVNAYAPGMVPTTLNHFTERPHEEQNELLATLTLRRWGTKDHIADLVCFLASDQAEYITGTLIDVSGGKLATQIPGLAYDIAAAETSV